MVATSRTTCATDFMSAIASRTRCDLRPRWMTWTISRRTSREYDIPRGLPYLLGMVIHCGIAEDAIVD